MRVARYSALDWWTRPDFGSEDGRAAADKTQYKPLHRGDPDRPGHFEMVVTRYPVPKSVPRHRHAHDQLRYTLAGSSPWSPENSTPTGSLLYIPSGTAYGPYERPTDIELLSIEFEGANRAPFLDIDTLHEAHQRLAARGRFEGNVYHWVDEAGEPQKLNARRARELEALGFVPQPPHPRFATPIEIDPDRFGGTLIAGRTAIRHLVAFEESGTAISMLSLEVEATHGYTARGTELMFVTAGSGEMSGTRLSERDAVHLESENVAIESETGLEMLVLRLPRPVDTTQETIEEEGNARQPAA